MDRYIEISQGIAQHVLSEYRNFLKGPMAMVEHWKATPQRIGYLEDFKEDFLKMFVITQNEILLILGVAVSLTFARLLFSGFIFQPLALRYKLESREAGKLSESGFKVLYCTMLWGFAHYLLFYSGEHNYFQDPDAAWKGWSRGMYVEPKLYWLYMIQLGFYFHSVYATYFMDERRNDHYAMVIHHIVTILLIGFSYCTRYHRVGLQVLYVHDFCDVCMELAKCFQYFKVQNGALVWVFEFLSNVVFGIFVLAWIYFRLYVYPCQVFLSTSYHSLNSTSPPPILYQFFNSLLLILLVLHLFWFVLILKVLHRVLWLGKPAEDNREEDSRTKKNQ
eukprot:Nk52_evm13s247 gene=Nk52_evmTU13s247